MKHAMIAFNPETADKYEMVDFYRCCVFRMEKPVASDLTNKSVAVIYRAKLELLVGEFEVVRVETISQPTTAEGKDIYQKAFGYPVTLYDGEYVGPTHVFYRNLLVYSPSVPFAKFMDFRNQRRIDTRHPITHIWLDEEDLDYIRSETTLVSVAGLPSSRFVDPYET